MNILLPKARWNKLFLLAREWFMEVNSENRALGQGGSRVGDVTVNKSKSDQEHHWQYESSAPVPKEVFDLTSIDYTQDNYSAGNVRTQFQYKTKLISGGVFLSNGVTHVSVYDSSGNLMPEYSTQKHIQKKKSQLSLAPVKHIEGITANLYGNVENTAGNYGHWMVDALAKLFLMERNQQLENIDQFLVPRLKYDFQLESLMAFGIPEAKILQIDTLECFSFENLLCASAPREDSSGVCPAWAIDGFRKRLLPQIASNNTKSRLYISRKDASSRNFTNEDELTALLETYGFESVELSSYGFFEKIKLFANAECVVGLTGAGLTNLMFCPKGTSVLELMPGSNVNYLYTSICGYLNLNFEPLIFHTGDLLSKINKYQGNLYLEPSVLEASLNKLLSK